MIHTPICTRYPFNFFHIGHFLANQVSKNPNGNNFAIKEMIVFHDNVAVISVYSVSQDHDSLITVRAICMIASAYFSILKYTLLSQLLPTAKGGSQIPLSTVHLTEKIKSQNQCLL